MKKLKNKKTGEIGELQTTEKHYAVVVGNGTANCNVKLYCSLAKLNESWEDYEKPIQVYIEGIQNVFMSGGRVYIDYATAKEAELAVRKLKAWKRLKDKGFKFLGVKGLDYAIEFGVNPPYTHIIFDEYTATEEQKEFYNDLILLFGGEE